MRLRNERCKFFPQSFIIRPYFCLTKTDFQDSEDEDFETVRALPPAKRIKMMAESNVKAEAKAESEVKTESDADTSDETDYSTDSDSE